MHSLSVTIITKNEAANIRACIESVAWADEIIVVDSGSHDGTIEICRELGAQVFVHDWPGFGMQKNRALSYASKDWILSLDADERVTPELRDRIVSAVQAAQHDGYYLPRRSQFCGQFIQHCGWNPDYVLRLFKRGKGKFSADLVHESILLNGATGKLNSPLLHYSYRTEADVQRKIQQYATAAAQQMFHAGKVAGSLDAPLHAAWAFVRTYGLRLGFLDGKAGYAIARMNATTTFLKYQKLRQTCLARQVQ